MIGPKDANLNVTQFVYDDADRLIEAIDPFLNSTTMDYDKVGNLTQTVDRNGRIRNYTYDVLNRQETEEWVENGSAVNLLQFTYDGVGNVLTAGDNFSQYTFTYDELLPTELRSHFLPNCGCRDFEGQSGRFAELLRILEKPVVAISI